MGMRSAAEILAGAWMSGDMRLFQSCADELVSRGDQQVLDEALTLLPREARAEARSVLNSIGEIHHHVDRAGETVCAELFALAIVPTTGGCPVPGDILAGLQAPGIFTQGVSFVVVDGWHRVADVVSMGPCRMRHVIQSCIAGVETIGTRPSPFPLTGERSVLMVVAVLVSGNSIEDDRSPMRDDDDLMDSLLHGWRESLLGCRCPSIVDVVRPCAPSMLEDELAIHVSGAVGRAVAIPLRAGVVLH